MDTLTLGHGEATVTLVNFAPPHSIDPYAGGTLEVVLQGNGLSARRDVFIFGHSSLESFFGEIAEQWPRLERIKVLGVARA